MDVPTLSSQHLQRNHPLRVPHQVIRASGTPVASKSPIALPERSSDARDSISMRNPPAAQAQLRTTRLVATLRVPESVTSKATAGLTR